MNDVRPVSKTHLDALRLIPQSTGSSSVLVQLFGQVGDDSPQPHHLLVIVRVHYRHYVAYDFVRRVLSPERGSCPKGRVRSFGGQEQARWDGGIYREVPIGQAAADFRLYIKCSSAHLLAVTV